jgi:uncharacterized protein YjbJ (UPF0337 family)
MNWDRIEGNWKQFKGTAKAKWGKLTDDQLDVIAGKREHLAGKIQEAYGITLETSQRQIDQWQADQKEELKEEEKAVEVAQEKAKVLKDLQ